MATAGMRPTAGELEVARALIARTKAAVSWIKKAEELLVCAAVAYRAGEFNKVPTACARAMGNEISRPKQVTDWVARLEKLAPELASGGGLLVQDSWVAFASMIWPAQPAPQYPQATLGTSVQTSHW